MLKRILVLDDNQDILEVVNEVLSYEHFDVHATSNSNGIVAVAEKFNPDLIILDYRLSNANGGEICLELKAHPKFKDTPVIIFSAYISMNVDFDKYRCDAVISKPFDLSQLIETVNGLIK
ncbi:response regulator [Mucilaginibacter mali]|uniref:Response regulator n=1 Tax=Mucilaginibacter mali TaxID=2740462 RepID=A0A7D4PS43_9SPHI|nr:response regulator [Mucilaginibacter mali]QKJ28723.1 response regulator [Mucilaginibacter mali]